MSEAGQLPACAADNIARRSVVAVCGGAADGNISLVRNVSCMDREVQPVEFVTEICIVERVSGYGQRAVRCAGGDADVTNATPEIQSTERGLVKRVVGQQAGCLLRHQDGTMAE